MRNFHLNIDKMFRLRGVSLVLVATVLATGLAGCGKKADCNVEGSHAHLYTNEDGMERYVAKEYESYEGFERHDESIPLTEEEATLYKFLDKKDLVSLDDNLEFLLAQQEQNKDYVEYRYSYRKRVTRLVGKTPMRMTVTRYSWTSNPNHPDLTGETRNCHYVYQGFNVYKDDRGKYVVIPSEEVDDINKLVGEYAYVKVGYYKVINLDNHLEVDYEDGQEESYDAVEQSYSADNEDKAKVLAKTY